MAKQRKINWATKNLTSVDRLEKIHNPRIWAKVFNQKTPFTFCSNEDCVYRKQESCPAGNLKTSCPNVSSLDYESGCDHYIGKPYQSPLLQDSISGRFKIITVITGRGTGKSSVIDTQKVLMEATTEPYVRAYLSKSNIPIPTKILVVGNTKATSLLLRHSIHNAFQSSESLYSFVEDDSKTYISTNNGTCEIHFLTAGVDGRGARGHHAEIIKNIEKMNVKCTIIIILDEGMFTRATSIFSEVFIPSLQVGNTFSQALVTSTPYGNKGEISDMRKNPIESQLDVRFASYHNKYSDVMLLSELRKKMIKTGQGPIYNREVLGLEESDDSLYWSFKIWSKSIDGSIDWMDLEEIESLKRKAEHLPLPGKYYCAVDPNKFREIPGGDFAAFLLVQVASDRSRVRAIAYGKYLMDTEDTFIDRLKLINEVFQPVFCADENSGYGSKLRKEGFDARNCSNKRHKMNPAMRACKQDVIDGIYKQPFSQQWEDERQCFVPKEDGVYNIPILDHKGNWGEGFSSDLMRCLGYLYEQLMKDYNIDGSGQVTVSSINSVPSNIGIVKGSKQFDSVLKSSRNRFPKVKR